MSNKAFEEARKNFVATLSLNNEANFSPCSSPDDIVNTLKSLEWLSRDKQRKLLPRCLAVIKKLNDRLQPYFDALNILASAETNAALAYGAFRTVLQLASGFPSFFEKLIALLAKLADKFPQYEAIVWMFEGDPPPQIRHHLESVYRDLFDFLHITARIFTASSGKVKRPVRVIATVIWEPFDARFSSLIDRMDNHHKFVFDELHIMVAQLNKNAGQTAKLEGPLIKKERQERVKDREHARKHSKETEEIKRMVKKESRDSAIQRILDWLAPPPFVETLESSKDQRQESTALWVFDNDAFKKWKESRPRVDAHAKWKKLPPWVLWVSGNPGCGKTVLAASVTEELLYEEDNNDRPKTTCYFFFKYSDHRSSSIEAAFRSTLAQILHRHRDDDNLLDKLLFARIDPAGSSGQSIASLKELLGLLRVCSTDFGQLSLILDGIDESDEPDSVCTKLKDLVTTSPVKLICFSRPNVNCLQKWTPEAQLISFDRLVTNSDIRFYLTHQLEALQDDGMLSGTDSTSLQHLANMLVHGADGMFLWAKLMIKYLSSPALTPSSRLNIINSVRFPEGLNVMYDRIFTLISNSRKPELDLARRILIWLDFSVSVEGGLTQRILQSAVTDFDEQHDVSGSDFISVVVSVCGGLVEFTPQARFQFAHQTVKEYMQERAWSRIGLDASLIPGEAAAAAEMASVCVQYLLVHAPQQAPHKSAESWSYYKIAEFQLSFQGYAVRHWGYHLSKAAPDCLSQARQDSCEVQIAAKLLETLNHFVGAPLALGYWIEGIYKSHTPVPDILSDIEHFASSQILKGQMQQVLGGWGKISQRLLDLAKGVHELDRDWGAKLSITPSLIWDDASIFLGGSIPSKIREAFGVPAISILAPEAPRDNCDIAVPCLCTISSTAGDGTAVGVLSIFPSPQFGKFWKTMDSATAYYNAERFTSGWIAKYNIYSTTSKEKMTVLEILIPDTEILLLLRQSFRQNASESSLSQQDDDNFVTSFPLAIGPDCLTFCVLRTVYNIQQIDPSHPGLLRSFVLPLEFLDHFNSKWTAQLATFELKQATAVPRMLSICWRDWYKYSLYFSPGGKYIGFADYQKPMTTHLAVFEVLSCTDFSIHLVQWMNAWLNIPRVQQMVFHPAETLVAILSNNKVWIWDFLKEGSTTELMPTQFDTCITDFKRIETANSGICKMPCPKHIQPVIDCRIKCLTFSQCGNFVVANTEKQVDVLHIPQKMLVSKTLSHSTQVSYLANLDESKAVSENPLSLMNSGLHPGSIISGNHLISRGTTNSPSRALLVRTTDNDLNVHLAGHDVSANSGYYRLLSMPKSLDARNMSVGIRMPKSSDDSLRIMFNKTSEESYRLGGDSEGRFQSPMILERRITSITRVLEPGSNQSESGKHYLEGPPPKRLRGDDNAPSLEDTL